MVFCLFVFWPCCVACGILVPPPGIELEPSAVKAQSPDHWTAKKSPRNTVFHQTLVFRSWLRAGDGLSEFRGQLYFETEGEGHTLPGAC